MGGAPPSGCPALALIYQTACWGRQGDSRATLQRRGSVNKTRFLHKREQGYILREDGRTSRYHFNAVYPSIRLLLGYLNGVTPRLVLGLVVERRGVLRLLFLVVETQRMLHLVAEALAFGGVAVTAVLFLVDVAAAATLHLVLVMSCVRGTG